VSSGSLHRPTTARIRRTPRSSDARLDELGSEGLESVQISEEGPLAAVRCSDVGGAKHEPPCVVPEVGQGAEYGTLTCPDSSVVIRAGCRCRPDPAGPTDAVGADYPSGQVSDLMAVGASGPEWIGGGVGPLAGSWRVGGGWRCAATGLSCDDEHLRPHHGVQGADDRCHVVRGDAPGVLPCSEVWSARAAVGRASWGRGGRRWRRRLASCTEPLGFPCGLVVGGDSRAEPGEMAGTVLVVGSGFIPGLVLPLPLSAGRWPRSRV
jgi:hypothetical protein